MIVFGIDPGVHGALAALQNGSYAGVWDLPVCQQGSLKWVDPTRLGPLLTEACRSHGMAKGTVHAFVERIHFVNRGGVLNAPVILGSILAALQSWEVPFTVVQASVWKRSLGLLAPKASDAQRKQAALAKARRMFGSPLLQREKDHNRAEALLIAWYGHGKFVDAWKKAA